MPQLMSHKDLLKGKVVLFNAPAFCGKDAITSAMVAATGCTHGEFKTTIHNIAMAITGLSPQDYFKIYNDRTKKEVPQPEMFNLSPRALLIWISEEVCKPKFGERYFGMSAANAASKSTGTCFSDSGFPEEVFPLAEKFGAENIFVIQFTREGRTFEGDSRDYLQPTDCPEGVHFFRTTNDSTLEDFQSDVIHFISCTARDNK